MQQMADNMDRLAEQISKGGEPITDIRATGESLRNAAGELARAAVRELTGDLRQHALDLAGATARFCDTLAESG